MVEEAKYTASSVRFVHNIEIILVFHAGNKIYAIFLFYPGNRYSTPIVDWSTYNESTWRAEIGGMASVASTFANIPVNAIKVSYLGIL